MPAITQAKEINTLFAFAAAIAVSVMLIGAPLAFAVEAQPNNSAAPGAQHKNSAAPGAQHKAPRHNGNVYKETPPGAKSEAYGDAKHGPDHLRRISPTERMPASPQVQKTIPNGNR